MQPHDELLHYGVKGMRWGVTNRRERYLQKAQSHTDKADSLRDKAKKTGPFVTKKEAAARQDFKANNLRSKAQRLQTRHRDTEIRNKAMADRYKNVAKSNLMSSKRLNKLANRLEKSKYTTMGDLEKAYALSEHAKRHSFVATTQTRAAQRIMGQPLSKYSKEDKTRVIKDVGTIAAMAVAIKFITS